MCQILKESSQNGRRYRADTIFYVKAEWPWRYRSRSRVITCDTPCHAIDHLCQIWKESILNCRCYRADTGCGTDGRADRRTDGQSETNIPPNNFVVWGVWLCQWHCKYALMIFRLNSFRDRVPIQAWRKWYYSMETLVTRMWNMISLPATPTVCLEQKSENFRSRKWHYRCRHNLKNNCICDNLQCCLLVPRSPSKPVMLTLTCNLEKCNSLRSSFGVYNLERQLRYWHLLTRHCPCNLLPEPTSPKHEKIEKLWGHPVTSSMTSSP